MTTTSLITDYQTQRWVGFHIQKVLNETGNLVACTEITASLIADHGWQMLGNWLFWLKQRICQITDNGRSYFYTRLLTILEHELKL